MNTIITVRYEVAQKTGEYIIFNDQDQPTTTIKAKNLDEFIRQAIDQNTQRQNEGRQVSLSRTPLRMTEAI